MIFITRIENAKEVYNGICLQCARDMGNPKFNELMRHIGLSEEDIDIISPEVDPDSLVEFNSENEENDDGKAPAIDLKKLFSLMFCLTITNPSYNRT